MTYINRCWVFICYRIYWTCHLQFLWLKFTVYIVLLLVHTQSTVHYMRWVFSVCCPTAVLWCQLPTVGISLPEFPNYPRPTVTATRDSQCTHKIPPSGTASSCPDLYCPEPHPVINSSCHWAHPNNWLTEVGVEVILWPTVSWPARLGIGLPHGDHDQNLITVKH